MRVVRIADRDPDLLRYLATRGIVPGVRVVVLPRPYGGMLNIQVVGADEVGVGGAIASISVALARDIRVAQGA